MTPIIATIITAVVIAAIIAVAIVYIIRTRKKGIKCIGCPENGCSSCSCNCQSKEQ